MEPDPYGDGSSGATTLIFIVEGAREVSSVMRSAMPGGNMVPPIDERRWRVQVTTDVSTSTHDGLEGAVVDGGLPSDEGWKSTSPARYQ
jgi:hypothetical protein